MKYGESTFDIIYLLFALTSGIVILLKRRDSAGRLMGFSALILGAGDAFHLVPRVMNYYIDYDFSFWLGTGKLITSVTMTVFYVLLYLLHCRIYNSKNGSAIGIAVFLSAVIRIALCLFPQNGWFTNSNSLFWAIARNIPFAALGLLIVLLYWQTRRKIRELSRIWLYVTLSFLFYIPVATGAGAVPLLGMLMLPKTVCYMLLIAAFLRTVINYSKKRDINTICGHEIEFIILF